jgi:hypothetical protein
MALTDNLAVGWKLDEASGSRADVLAVQTLTDNNTVTSAAGVGGAGTSAQFTAANLESLSRADNATLSMGNIDFTIAVWVYLDDLTPNPIVSKWTGGLGNKEYLLMQDNSSYYSTGTRFVFIVDPVGDTSTMGVANANVLGAPSTGTWYHVVAWHDAANDQLGIAVNAGSATTVSHTHGVADTGSDFALGTFQAGLDHFNGRLQSVYIWKRVLSGAERTELYNGGATLDYPFGGGGGSVGMVTPCRGRRTKAH